MPGTGQHSGGKRIGAGRPPRKFTFEIGEYAMMLTTPDGHSTASPGRVVHIDRTALVIQFANEDLLTIYRHTYPPPV